MRKTVPKNRAGGTGYENEVVVLIDEMGHWEGAEGMVNDGTTHSP